MLHTAAVLASAYQARFAQSGIVDLQAGADTAPRPSFGSEKIDTLEAAGGVLSFNGAGKMVTAKAQSHFLVGGQTVKEGDCVELPEAEFKRMGPNGTNQVVEATDDDIAAAQKAAAKTK